MWLLTALLLQSLSFCADCSLARRITSSYLLVRAAVTQSSPSYALWPHWGEVDCPAMCTATPHLR